MIPIQNIYYMLAYAYQILRENGYASLAAEPFTNTADLLSAILIRGVSIQIKRGLHKAYLPESDLLSCPRGKINVSESMKRQSLSRQTLHCTYDVFSVNSYPNRILKTTMTILLRSDITPARKKELRNLLPYFETVSLLRPAEIQWNFRYDRNNQSYRMLLSVCWLVLKGLLQTTSDGTIKLMDFLDEQRMCRLYEKFLLEYYRKEYPQLSPTAPHIPWALDNGYAFLLPQMKSDVVLWGHGKVLILDAKYYAHTTQRYFDVPTLHSNNLYQIFTYVKNQAATGEKVSGLLLYAKTDDSIQPHDASYWMSGNHICAQTLDLNCDFSQISAQLNRIAQQFMDGTL